MFAVTLKNRSCSGASWLWTRLTVTRLGLVAALAGCSGTPTTSGTGTEVGGGTGAGLGGAGATASTGGANSSGGGTQTGGASSSAGGAGGGSTIYSPCPSAGTPCKILPLGDSITSGVGSAGANSNGGYRVELFARALGAGTPVTFVGSAPANGPATVSGVPFPTANSGYSGYTIDDEPATPTLSARHGISPLVGTMIPTYDPDIVLLMIGTNDIQHDIDIANAPTRLAALIDHLLVLSPRALLVVAQIPPTTDATLNPNIEQYNAAIPGLVADRQAAGQHITVVDVYHAMTNNPAFRTSGRTVADPSVGLMYDWLHPNVAGYVVIGDTWFEAIRSVLH